jgi:hypothetical protein
MLMTEWNWDDAKEVWFEEGRKDNKVEEVKEGSGYCRVLGKWGLVPLAGIARQGIRYDGSFFYNI